MRPSQPCGAVGSGVVVEGRARSGWVNTYKPRAKFVAFLEEQEQAMKALLNGLGIETVR